ncbi:unnamed protein product [Larinioides sclopetarius]|uniref:Uncharacterized protein n=1 Tax=Larinioides sclopetarius TaxID=280406 RepID=A0AAV1ZL92_9ARAC
MRLGDLVSSKSSISSSVKKKMSSSSGRRPSDTISFPRCLYPFLQ